MMETIRAQLPKQVVGAMVGVGMKPMLPKVIRKEACLQAKGPSKLSKDLEPKRRPNI